MKGKIQKQWLAVLVLRFFIGGVFIWAGATKVVSPEKFAAIVENYRILPPFWVAPIAIWLPWIELLCGLFLLLGIFVRGGALTVASLMIIFIGLQTVNMFRGLDVACGCFSVSPDVKTDTTLNIFRDLPILIGALWLFFRLMVPAAEDSRETNVGTQPLPR